MRLPARLLQGRRRPCQRSFRCRGQPGARYFEDGLFGDDEATASGPQASGGQADTPSGGGQTHTASSGSQTSSKPQAGDTSSRPTNSGTQNLVGNTYTSGFPIVKDKVTLKILTYSRPAHAKDWDSMYFSKKYEEKTNIHIDWSVVPQSSIIEQTKIMLQTQSYPDILIVPAGVLYDSDVYTYGTQNVLWDSSQSLKAYAPNLYDLMKNDKTIRMAVQQQNGSIYSLPYINYDYPGAPAMPGPSTKNGWISWGCPSPKPPRSSSRCCWPSKTTIPTAMASRTRFPS